MTMAMIDFTDITANLPSVQFESALTDDELLESHLRHKCHSLLYYACAQSVYFVSSLNEFRENRLQVLNPNDKRQSNKLLRDLQAKEPLLVGIIGFGRLGSRLASLLVNGSGLMPEELKISTRRPELASDLTSRGASCAFDNAAVASSVHLLFLCCPPASLPAVAEEIRDHLPPRTIVYSFVTGYRERKLRQLLEHETLVCPTYRCRFDHAHAWPVPADMAELLGQQAAAEAACPTPDNPAARFLVTESKLVALWIYAVANLCTLKRHTIDETLSIVNHIFVRSAIRPKLPNDEEPEEQNEKPEVATATLLLCPGDLIRGLEAKDKHLPTFDLAEISLQDTYLDERLQRDAEIRRAFTERFCQRLSAAYNKLKFVQA